MVLAPLLSVHPFCPKTQRQPITVIFYVVRLIILHGGSSAQRLGCASEALREFGPASPFRQTEQQPAGQPPAGRRRCDTMSLPVARGDYWVYFILRVAVLEISGAGTAGRVRGYAPASRLGSRRAVLLDARPRHPS